MHCLLPLLKHQPLCFKKPDSQTEETACRSAPVLFLVALWLMSGWPGPLGALSMEVVSRLLQILTGHEA